MVDKPQPARLASVASQIQILTNGCEEVMRLGGFQVFPMGVVKISPPDDAA